MAANNSVSLGYESLVDESTPVHHSMRPQDVPAIVNNNICRYGACDSLDGAAKGKQQHYRLSYDSLDGDMICNKSDVSHSDESSPLLFSKSDSEKAKDDGQQEVKVRKPWTMILTVALASITPLSRGFVTGYTSPSVDRFVEEGMLTHGETSVFGALVNFGGLISCLIMSLALSRLGRRGTLMAATVPQLIGWLCLWFGNEHIAVILGRVLNGFGSAVVFSAFNIYISETSHKTHRGTFGTCLELFICTGTTLAFLIGQYLTNQHLAAFGAALSLVTFVATLPLKESPRWLIEKGRLAEGFATLAWLRGAKQDSSAMDEKVTEEFNEIKANLEECGKHERSLCDGGWWRELWAIKKPLGICVGMMLLQGMGGSVAVVAFMQPIFQKAHIAHPGLATVGMGVLRFVATGVAAVLIDKVGRRNLLIWGGFLQVFGVGLLSASFFLQNALVPLTYGLNQTIDLNGTMGNETTAAYVDCRPYAELLAYLAVFSLGVFLFAYSLAWGTVPSLVISELFPQRHRAVASSICTFAGLSAGTVNAFTYTPLYHTAGEGVTFAMYSLIGLLGVILVAVFLTETKNRSLEELAEDVLVHPSEPVTSQPPACKSLISRHDVGKVVPSKRLVGEGETSQRHTTDAVTPKVPPPSMNTSNSSDSWLFEVTPHAAQNFLHQTGSASGRVANQSESFTEVFFK